MGRVRHITCKVYVQEWRDVVVPLEGRDFTGLGFGVHGNWRDGLYVREVMSQVGSMTISLVFYQWITVRYTLL